MPNETHEKALRVVPKAKAVAIGTRDRRAGLNRNLIYDVGVHVGEDTEYYLKKGFQVVGVEANPMLCGELLRKFDRPIADSRLKLVNKAISGAAGLTKFYVNSDVTAWGTLDEKIGYREIVGRASIVVR
jgi:hypothetical protein